MKLPGTYFMYALLMSLFGENTTGVHLGLMAANCITILLVYKIGEKTVSTLAGLVAACSYAFLSLSPSVLGFAGHATHFVALWAMAGLLVLLYALERNKPLLYGAAGALLSLAFLMKQPGVFFIVLGAGCIIINAFERRPPMLRQALSHLGVFSCGVLLPVSVMILYLSVAGVLAKFWFFTFVYASQYVTQVPLSLAAGIFMSSFFNVADGFFLVWVSAALGLVALFLNPVLRNRRLPISLFAACSLLTVCPGFYFRPHYFVTLLPVVSLLAGIFADYLRTVLARVLKSSPSTPVLPTCIAIAVFAPALIIGIVRQSDYLFEEDPFYLSRNIYAFNPFPESIDIARFIKTNTAVDDTIAVLGSEPQIFFYSGRHSATEHIYTYGLMEIHPYSLVMQREMAMEIERSRPRFLVAVNMPTSWAARSESEKFIFRWADDYVSKYYDLVGRVDNIGPDKTSVYKWGKDARSYTPQSTSNVSVFQRR